MLKIKLMTQGLLTDSVGLERCNIFLLFFPWNDGEMHNYEYLYLCQ